MNIIQKLRQNAASGDSCEGVSEDMEEAANEIERLTLALASRNEPAQAEPAQAEPVLEACPFCGGPAMYDRYIASKDTYLALCLKCNISTIDGTKMEVAKAWNRRAGKEQP